MTRLSMVERAAMGSDKTSPVAQRVEEPAMDWYRFEIGRFKCVAINDGDTTYAADDYVANPPPDQVAREMHPHGQGPRLIPSPYSGLLIDTGSYRVLVDTGAGELTPNVGKLSDGEGGEKRGPERA